MALSEAIASIDASQAASAARTRDALARTTLPSRAEMQQIVHDAAVRLGVSPKLALAHAYIESGFDHGRVSDAHAVGAMQLVPAAGRFASRLLGRELNIADPRDNATAGVAIIAYLQARAAYRDQGIAAYYQGLDSVLTHGVLPETRTYVVRVIRSMRYF